MSKIFEICLLAKINTLLDSHPRQLGFKRNFNCSLGIYAVKRTVQYFCGRGSTVNLCSVDVKKAFDKTNNYRLLAKLFDRGLPVRVILLLKRWLENSVIRVKWNNTLSYPVKLTAGVRQGSVLSPTFFNLYVNDLLNILAHSNIGCFYNRVCLNSFMYADDIMLLAITVTDLQKLVSLCANFLEDVDLSVNSSKTKCIRIGPNYKDACKCISIGNNVIAWTNEISYLGVKILAGKDYFSNYDDRKRKFYGCFNKIYHKIKTNDTAIVLELLKTICLPTLLYGIECSNFKKSDWSSLINCLDRAYMKIFNTFDPLVVKYCMLYTNMLPLKYTIEIRRVKFLRNLLHNYNISSDLRHFLFNNDDWLKDNVLFQEFSIE